MISAALFALAACLPVSAGSDRILARDLVPALPQWAAVAPETPLALAPAPGVTRVFRISELRRLAARWNLEDAPEHEVCFARPVAPLDPARLLEAMRKQLPGNRIEILEHSRQTAPEGSIEFPREGLRGTASGAVWTGSIAYAGNRRFPIWARVAVTATGVRVLAVGDLKPGQPISAAQVIVQSRQEFPGNVPFAVALDEVIGKCPRQKIPAGAAIRTDQLEKRREVMRGENVQVVVRNGGAVLELAGQAEASGTIGETIPVRNPISQKRFLARIEGKGKVAVDSSAAQGKP